jgi:putative tricarboxylic transport membrane protein
MNSEKTGALLCLLFSVAYGLGAFTIPLTFLSQDEVINARTMPFALSIAGAVISLLIILLPTIDVQGRMSLKAVFGGLDWRRAAWFLGITIVYGLIMKWLGFIISSILFLNAGFYILGERKIKLMLLASVPLVIGLFLLMSYILGMYIAPGEIFYLIGVIK